MWQKTNTNKILANLQQNIIVPYHTMHDEIDCVVSARLVKPISTKLAYIANAKRQVESNAKCGYVNFLFDCEYNEANQSWIPAQSVNPYLYPKTHSEHKAFMKMQQSECDLNGK